MGGYDEKEEVFHESGPAHLAQTEIDWKNHEHRRCMTASLVGGTYVLESDRTRRRASNPLAPSWWEKFHFRKLYTLEHACTCEICNRSTSDNRQWIVYGAVFEYTPPDGVTRHPSAPSHIVAFRGTMTWDHTVVVNDMLQNFNIFINWQHMCGRFTDARQNVQRLVSDNNGSGEIWLAGHSLGASIALNVGRDMVIRRGRNLPTFLFNPPHVSISAAQEFFKKIPGSTLLIDAIPEKAKRVLSKSNHLLKWVLGKTIVRSHWEHMEELFRQLSPWVPNLYVHRGDFICKGFVEYFERREQAKEMLSSRVVNLATTLSYRDMVFQSHSNDHYGLQQLLPCGVLWTTSHGDDHHCLKQWWRPTGPKLDLRHDEYSWFR